MGTGGVAGLVSLVRGVSTNPTEWILDDAEGKQRRSD